MQEEVEAKQEVEDEEEEEEQVEEGVEEEEDKEEEKGKEEKEDEEGAGGGSRPSFWSRARGTGCWGRVTPGGRVGVPGGGGPAHWGRGYWGLEYWGLEYWGPRLLWSPCRSSAFGLTPSIALIWTHELWPGLATSGCWVGCTLRAGESWWQ
jgi:hypothetical protein